MAMLNWPRHDAAELSIEGGLVSVYRRDDDLVHGPCMSLEVADVELLRFDLPVGKAHEHWSAIPGKPRMYYPRSWSLDQLVELACSDLVEHAKPAAKLAGLDAPVRTELRRAAEWARPRLLGAS